MTVAAAPSLSSSLSPCQLRAKPPEGVMTEEIMLEKAEKRMLAGPAEPIKPGKDYKHEIQAMIRAREKKVVVAPSTQPFKLHFVLKFVWTDKVLGVSLNAANARGETPMCPYFFWPREDAWEILKDMLLEREWVPNELKVEVLNKVTEVLTFWGEQDENANRINTIDAAREKFPEHDFQGA